MKNKKEYFWALLGRFIPQTIYLLTTIILARFLSPQDFGMIGVLTLFCTISSVLMDSGLGGSLIKENKITNLDCSSIFVFNIIISLILYFTLFICSDYIEYYFSHKGLSEVTKLLCLVFIINSWGIVPKSILMRELNFKAIGKISIISVIIASIISIILGVNGYGVYALIAYQLVNSLINVILLIKESTYKISFKFSYHSFMKLIPFGAFTTLVTCIDTLYENMITFLFGKYYNIQQAGYFYQAKKIEEVPSHSLISTINGVAFSVLTKYKDTPNEFISESNKILKTISAFMIPLLLTISLFSEPIINLLYGEKWNLAAVYLSILMFAGIFILLENINRNFIKSLGKVSLLFRYTIIKRVLGILLILGIAYLSPQYVLYAYIVSSLLGYLINNHVYCKLMNISVMSQIIVVIKLLAPGLFYYGLIYILGFWFDLPYQIFVSSFILIIYYFKILSLYNINLIKRIKSVILK